MFIDYLSIYLSIYLSADGQIRMNSAGQVGIGTTPSSSYRLCVNGPIYTNNNLIAGNNLSVNGGNMYISEGLKIDGYWGMVRIGIGTNYSSSNVVRIAGYSSGHTLYVEGNAHFTQGYSSSDQIIKKNVQTFNRSEILEKLVSLDGISFEYKNKDELKNLHDEELLRFENNTISTYDSITNELVKVDRLAIPYYPEGKYFGLIAQDVEKVFPELVKIDSVSNILGVNYSGFIPLLIEALKDQQQKISMLENEIENLKVNDRLKSANASEFKSDDKNILFQNTPNPFSESTKIEYSLAENVNKAFINIYNMNGTQLKSIQLHLTGKGNVTIHGYEFKAGMYLFSLIADGKVIDTKRMVLTD